MAMVENLEFFDAPTESTIKRLLADLRDHRLGVGITLRRKVAAACAGTAVCWKMF